MIAVLQRQHVQKRAAMPVRLKTRLTTRGLSGRFSRWENRVTAIPARFVPSGAPSDRFRNIRHKSLVLAKMLPVPIILVAVVLVLALVLMVPRIRMLTLPQERPLLPSPPETDQSVYRMVVPDEAPHAGAATSPILSSTLKISQYKTQAGESISQIAQRFKLNLDTLVSWNNIRDARSLRPGMMLGIPNTDGLRYTVRRGDTLEQIARANGLSLNAILDWNQLPSSVISVGQAIFLPGAHMRTDEINRIMGNLFIYPVRGKISSYFGNRPDPFTGVRRFHNGVDIVNAPGTPIMAAMAGSVEDVGFNNNYGYYVILRHSGYQTLYGHLSRYIVARGQKVQQGQEIGELGTTGYSTGPHLHFSVFRNGEAVDPLSFLK
ncbi:MAG TPA: M23 family metallopeptidase [Spirochaetia bacterium]|nr:M23 family metallopeptidase [Spirochaetia bacterium]